MLHEKDLPGGGCIPTIGLGTWRMGGYMSPDTSRDRETVAVLKAAIEMGYRHIDTAEMYGGGHTEELVGQAMQGFVRQELFIASKVLPEHLHYQDTLQACYASLDRLGSDYLDLYLIHWPNPRVPLEETFRALNELVRRNRIRHLGVCNFNLGNLKQARELSETPLVTNQVPYSLYQREYDVNGVLSFCQAAGILLTAYTPVEQGRVTKNPVLKEIAGKYGATPVQVALAWLARQPRVIAIPMSANEKHLRENLEAADLELSEADVARLDSQDRA
jgi:diketogulonate reductase-like aldo/keto reductase